ncbi:Wzz/FepE/Etk N-terminal domain-containing protein [Geofilum sp. OHC36d9]|uniref:Wzz/FepE/Etk N-terminal domain-containing protein n=1 Tax=Geofilum sp. OHC36d9 TaxID=3458413 RepID=UPI004034E38A
MSENTDKKGDFQPLIKGDRLNLMVLFDVLRKGKLVILYSTLLTALLALFLALVIPDRYEARAVILPNAESENSLDKLGGLASLAGVNLNSMIGQTSGISPEIYSTIIGSSPFLKELLNTPVSFEDEPSKMSLFEKARKDTVPGFGDKIIMYTVRLPWTIMDALKSDDRDPSALTNDTNLVVLDKRVELLYEKVRAMISVDYDPETGLVDIAVEGKEALQTSEIALRTTELLQRYIIAFETKQVRQNLDFIEAQYLNKKEEFEKNRAELNAYKDANRNVVGERVDVGYQLLADNYDLTRNLYMSLAEQKEQALVAVKKQTPAFSMIEPVRVPLEPVWPKKSFFMILGLIFGFLAGVIGVVGRAILISIQKNWAA